VFGAGLGFVVVLALLAWVLVDGPAGEESPSLPAATERPASAPLPPPRLPPPAS